MSVHPPRETKTRRGADRRALGGRRASPCGGALVPLWGKSFPSWDFGVSAAAFAAAPRQHKPPSEETVERQDSDEAQTKGKTRMVKFITIRGTRALSATPYYKGHGGVRAERWCCACAHCRLCVRKRTNLQPLQVSVQADEILLRNKLRCLNLASFGGLRFYCVINL